MLWLSEILMQHHELETFEQLEVVVKRRGQQGERFFRMDVKPPFRDTPVDWEGRLESAFTAF
ncbi:MAG: sulfur relay protein DsrC [Pseudomonadota bacterium]